jgi:hypothetical protein
VPVRVTYRGCDPAQSVRANLIVNFGYFVLPKFELAPLHRHTRIAVFR